MPTNQKYITNSLKFYLNSYFNPVNSLTGLFKELYSDAFTDLLLFGKIDLNSIINKKKQK